MLAVLWKYKTVIALGAAALLVTVLLLRIDSLKNDVEAGNVTIKDLTNQRDLAAAVAQANADALAKAKADHDRTVALLDEANAIGAARNETIKQIIREVNSAKPASCPAGDGLAAAHRGLRKLTGQDRN